MDEKNDRGRKNKLILQGDQQKAWWSLSADCSVLELMISKKKKILGRKSIHFIIWARRKVVIYPEFCKNKYILRCVSKWQIESICQAQKVFKALCVLPAANEMNIRKVRICLRAGKLCRESWAVLRPFVWGSCSWVTTTLGSNTGWGLKSDPAEKDLGCWLTAG